MRTIIREKLDQLDAIYPPQRLEKSRERWRRLWAGEEKLDRLPFMAGPVGLGIYDVIPAPERLLLYLDRCIDHGIFEDDYIPSYFPGCRQGTIPGMFGAAEIVVGNDYTCERPLSKYEETPNLPPPRIEKGSVADGWLEMAKYILQETEGRFPIHVTDMQGPVDIAGQLLGYDQLFIAAFEAPELYDRLLNATTDAFIMLWRAQKEILGDTFVGTHLLGWSFMPDGFGATVSVDSLVMVSSPFYEAYYQPYLERIGEAFGGVSVHSCGNYAGAIPAVMCTKNLRGINASQMTLQEVTDAGVDGRVVIIGNARTDTLADTLRLVVEKGLRMETTLNDIWPLNEQGAQKHPDQWTAADRDEIKRKNEKVLALYAR